MLETDLYARLKPYLDKWGDHQRIENAVGAGVPDVNYAVNGQQGWIELKVAKSGKLYFEKFQLPWMRRRARHSGPRTVWVLAVVKDQLFLWEASKLLQAPRETETNGRKTWTVVQIKHLVEVAEVNTPAPWSWNRIGRALAQS